jgi:Asp-tRNA(Asn)/Glu-tRNA(Gln) amidotransferase A subunit family amidase
MAVWLSTAAPAAQGQTPFRLEEATIADVQRAIRAGQVTCQGIVQGYINRGKAYNGVSSALVTPDGAPIAQAYGTVRAGSPLKFPTATVKASTLFPDLDQYTGPPIEWGRMEATSSDPGVQQQYGMLVGIPNAGQANALSTINIRGERSVTCKGAFDTRPADGPLAADAPPVCEEFRKQPDALERAAELDKQYGRNPDLAQLPMYCIPFSFKDPFDAKDMRSTGGADARYDIDFPARDHVLVGQLRNKGAIIYAKAVLTEYNGRAGNPGGRNKPTMVLPSTLGYQRSTWGGNPSNVYDTTRAGSLGSSSGSAVGVSANLVMCSLCEETRASCRGPANHNSVALILPHKALVGFNGGAIGSDIYNDRTGIHCRSITDSAKVLDALKDPKEGYYDPRDPFTTVPRSSVLTHPYADTAATPGTPGSLKGMRIGIIRESMLSAPGARAAQPIVTAAATEIKTVLGAQLGATLVESIDPLFTDDPAIENMTTTYTRALAKLIPVFMPDILFRIMLRELLRRVDMMVMYENHLDALVRLHTSLPPGKIGGANQGGQGGNAGSESAFGPNAGETEVLIPAGYVTEVYDGSFALSPDKKRYISVGNSTPTPVPPPGLPFSLVFRAEPGKEDVILKVASAYQNASKRRVSPPGFPPLSPTNQSKALPLISRQSP